MPSMSSIRNPARAPRAPDPGSVQHALRAISSPRRQEMLRLVWDREASAGEIASRFDVTWPAVSQNLRVLREAGLITERREGNYRYYRADRRAVGPLEPVLRGMWQRDLDRLRVLAEGEAKRAQTRGKARAKRKGRR